jgi:hypothetical protein
VELARAIAQETILYSEGIGLYDTARSAAEEGVDTAGAVTGGRGSELAQGARYSFYLLYSYKSTNTDT